MSANLKLSADELHKLGSFLTAISAATRETGVELGAYDSVAVRVAEDAVLAVSWDEGRDEYVVNDRSGS